MIRVKWHISACAATNGRVSMTLKHSFYSEALLLQQQAKTQSGCPDAPYGEQQRWNIAFNVSWISSHCRVMPNTGKWVAGKWRERLVLDKNVVHLLGNDENRPVRHPLPIPLRACLGDSSVSVSQTEIRCWFDGKSSCLCFPRASCFLLFWQPTSVSKADVVSRARCDFNISCGDIWTWMTSARCSEQHLYVPKYTSCISCLKVTPGGLFCGDFIFSVGGIQFIFLCCS